MKKDNNYQTVSITSLIEKRCDARALAMGHFANGIENFTFHRNSRLVSHSSSSKSMNRDSVNVVDPPMTKQRKQVSF